MMFILTYTFSFWLIIINKLRFSSPNYVLWICMVLKNASRFVLEEVKREKVKGKEKEADGEGKKKKIKEDILAFLFKFDDESTIFETIKEI